MIVRADTAVSFTVQFPSGQPDGNVVWTLYGSDGAEISNGSVTPPVGAVSIELTIPSSDNSLAAGVLRSFRDLDWSYTTGGATISDTRRYTIDARLPLGVSPDGVRSKLGGIESTDLPDSDVPLLQAYTSFRNTITGAIFDAAVTAGLDDLALCDAIEALAALSVLPSMPVRVASAEASSTNQYKRQTIDWSTLAGPLTDLVTAGYVALVPTYSDTSQFSDIFILASPATDAITGAAPTGT